MSNADDLPTLAPGGSQPMATRNRPDERPPERRSGGRLLEGILILLVVACLAGGGYFAYRLWNDVPPGLESDEAVSLDAGTGDGGDTTEADAGDEPAAPPDTAAGGTTSTVALPTPVANDDCQVRCSRIKGGVIYLEGAMPSQDAADEQEALAVAVMGGDESRVVSNVTVDSDAPATVDTYRVYIDDIILFASGSFQLDPAQTWVLDLGVVFLQLDQEATITVIGHTDASGDAADNYELSLERARAVKAYYVAGGAPADRIFVVPRGEADASGDDTPEDRRVEFQLGAVGEVPDGAIQE